MAYNQNPYFNGYYPQNYGYPNNGAMPDMLNQQKMAYQPQQMQMPQQLIPTPAQTNDFLWVLSRNEAESYPVAPNSTVTLWDKGEPVIYIKSANAQGVPSIRILDFTERTTENAPKMPTTHECQCGKKYVSKEDFEALKHEFQALKGKLEKPKKATVTPKEVENDG